MSWIKSPWVSVALAVAAFLLGVGDVPFTDLTSFTKWLNAHFPQVGGLGFVAAAAWYVLTKAREYVNRDVLARQLSSKQLQVGEVVGAFEDIGDWDTATLVKSAAADASFVALYHACDFDAELTDSLNTTHSLYRAKRVAAHE